MVDITGLIPLTAGGIVRQLIQVAIIAIVLMFTNKFLAHEMSLKNSFIMALVAYFLVPIALSFTNIAIPFAGYILPLVA